MTTPQPQPRPKVRLKVEPVEGGQLEQFLIVNTQASVAAKEAGEEAEERKAAVKNWLLSLFPDPADLPDAFDIAEDPYGRYPAYTMTLKEGSHLDREAMKRDGVYDGIYETYSVPNKASWELRPGTQEHRRRS